MEKYFKAYKSTFDSVVIDDSYKNLCLSRKILASSLPIVTLTEANGYMVKGNPQLREIELIGDECLVAVGGYTDKNCFYFNWSCPQKVGSEIKIKHFLCSASTVNGISDRLPQYDTDRDTQPTNISSSYYVPYDLYIYTFSPINEIVSVSSLPTTGNSNKKYFVTSGANAGKVYVWVNSSWVELTNAAVGNRDKCGLQIFNASGDVVFDSRNKYFRCLIGRYSGTTGIDNDVTYAIANVDPYVQIYNYEVGSESLFDRRARCYIGGAVMFDSNYISQRWPGEPWGNPHVGGGWRVTYVNSTPSDDAMILGQYNAPYYFVIDVTNF